MSAPRYHPAVGFGFRPDTGIRLGNIIADSQLPNEVLTAVTKEFLEENYPQIVTTTEKDCTIDEETYRGKYTSVIANIAGFLMAPFARQGMAGKSKYSAETIETQQFVGQPKEEEIKRRVMEPEVLKVIRPNRSPLTRNPVYMITGVKIAKALTKNVEEVTGGTIAMEGRTQVTTPMGDAVLEATVGGREQKSQRTGTAYAHDIVCAYTLLRLDLKGWWNVSVGARAELLSVDDEPGHASTSPGKASRLEKPEIKITEEEYWLKAIS